jgi:hypothetical protein
MTPAHKQQHISLRNAVCITGIICKFSHAVVIISPTGIPCITNASLTHEWPAALLLAHQEVVDQLEEDGALIISELTAAHQTATSQGLGSLPHPVAFRQVFNSV